MVETASCKIFRHWRPGLVLQMSAPNISLYLSTIFAMRYQRKLHALVCWINWHVACSV